MLATQGLAIDRSMLAFWVGYAGAELAPVYERLKANLLASSKILVDETTAPVLDQERTFIVSDKRSLNRGRTRRATSGRSPVTTGLGSAPSRPASPTPMRLDAAPSMP
jgi:hypothetical protein